MTVSDAALIISRLLPEPQAGLLAGILFGLKASFSTELYEDLIITGTLHIVALSGQNISILIGIIHFFLLSVVKRPIANIISIGVIAWFILFVGPSASVIRAGVMGGITLIGISFGRQVMPVFVWALAVIGMLVLNPRWIMDISFQLSVMATLGILLFGTKKEQKQDLSSPIRNNLRLTLAAQVFTIPIIMFAFGRISLVSPLSNLLIGWLIAPVMILGFALVLAGMIWMPLGQIIAWCAWLLLTFIVTAITLTAKIPFASVSF